MGGGGGGGGARGPFALCTKFLDHFQRPKPPLKSRAWQGEIKQNVTIHQPYILPGCAAHGKSKLGITRNIIFSLLASLTLHPARFIFQKGSMANSLQLTQLRHILQTLRITPDSYLPFFIKSNYLELWQYWGANNFFPRQILVPKRGVGVPGRIIFLPRLPW